MFVLFSTEATEEVSLESPEMPAVRPSDKAPTITPVSNTAKSVLTPDATNTPAAADQGARKLVSFRKTSEEVISFVLTPISSQLYF